MNFGTGLMTEHGKFTSAVRLNFLEFSIILIIIIEELRRLRFFF
jgi:hypothetical protein